MPRVTGVPARGPGLVVGAALAGALAIALAPAPADAAPRPLPRRVVEAFATPGAMFARGASDSAYAAIEAIAARALAAHDETLRVAAQFELGARLAWFGQLTRALPALQDARARAWTLRDTTRWVLSSQWLAYALNNSGSLAEGGSVARRALPAAVAIGDPRAEAYLRVSLAFVALSAGRAPEASRGYRRALASFETQRDGYGACEALLGLGRCYSVTGPPDSTRAIFERAARRAEWAKLPRSAASAYNNLAAQDYLAGDPEAALESWRLAARMGRAAGDLTGMIAATGNVCLALSNLGRVEEARPIADSLLAYVTRAGSNDGIAQVRSRIGLLELSAGRPAAAAREYRTALAYAARGDIEQRVECVSGLVRALVAQDSAQAALALHGQASPGLAGRTSAARDIELAQAGALAAFEADSFARAGTFAARALALARTAGSPRDELAAEQILARIAAKSGRFSVARAHLEKADLASRRHEARVEGLEWRSMLSQPALLGSAWAEVWLGEGVERRRSRIAPAFAAIERIRSTVLLELAAGPRSRTVATPAVTLDRIQRTVLAPGELLLLAWTWTDRSWLMAVSRDTAVSLPIASMSKLERDVTLVREALAADPPLEGAALDRLLAESGARLLEPLLPLLRRHSRVIVVPAGPLQRMPFEALRLPLGRGGALAPLGVTHVVARAPSASVLALARSRPAATRDGDLALLAVANPRDPKGRALPGASDEARSLEARYQGTSVIESPRDNEAVLRAMAGATTVHIAAHADFDAASPWRSALQLGAGPPVLARDLLARRLRTELVVLAACETAGGNSRGTGGMEGLSTALLCAGARGVVATLWPVEDRVARRFAEAFYEEAERAPDAGTALVRARSRLQAGGAATRDWAAFTLVGDPATRIRLTRKRLSLPGF